MVFPAYLPVHGELQGVCVLAGGGRGVSFRTDDSHQITRGLRRFQSLELPHLHDMQKEHK